MRYQTVFFLLSLFRKCYYPGALAFYSALDRCFAQRYASVIEPVSSAPTKDLSMVEKENSLSSPWPDNEEERDDKIDAGAKAECSSPREEEASLGLLSKSLPVACPRPGIHDYKSSNSRKVLSPSSSRAPSPLISRASSLAQPFSQSGIGVSSSPPLQMLFGDLVTPRESSGLMDGLASPRLEAFMESRASMPMHVHQEGSNLVFLSARPESYKGLTESESYRKYFQPMVVRGELDTSPTMLLGSLDSGPRALYKLLTGSWLLPDDPNPKTATAALYQTLAAKKLSRFREYAAIYPEAAFLYVGDNGQGDVLCAEILYSSARHAAAPRPSQLLACFIHRVVPPAATMSMLRRGKESEKDILKAWRDRNIFLHRTHVGMAVQAYDMGLLDVESLYRIGESARQDFRRILSRYGGRHAGRRLDKAARHLNEDIEKLNARLPPYLASLEPLTQLLPTKERPQ